MSCRRGIGGGEFMNFRLIGAVAAAAALGASAEAAVSTYPASVFQASGGTNAGNLVGNNPATARLNRSRTIGLAYGGDITGQRLLFNITSVTNNTTYLFVQFGNWDGSAFTGASGAGLVDPNGAPTPFAFAQVTAPGLITIFGDAFAASCLSIGGCNAVMFGNSGLSAAASSFRLSTLVAATPEPSAWALIMLGFAGVASRMKSLRRRHGPAPAVSAA